MNPNVVVVPGYRGSDEHHWQTWLQARLPEAERLSGVDWQQPRLDEWADALCTTLRVRADPVVLVAHSFGCLVSAAVMAAYPQKVAGAILVAPADPKRFSVQGLRATDDRDSEALTASLPLRPLNRPGLLIGSQNDPWMTLRRSHALARQWGFPFFNAGNVGHINTDSGHGAWPLVEWLTISLCDLAATRTGESERSSRRMNYALNYA